MTLLYLSAELDQERAVEKRLSRHDMRLQSGFLFNIYSKLSTSTVMQMSL